MTRQQWQQNEAARRAAALLPGDKSAGIKKMQQQVEHIARVSAPEARLQRRQEERDRALQGAREREKARKRNG